MVIKLHQEGRLSGKLRLLDDIGKIVRGLDGRANDIDLTRNLA